MTDALIVTSVPPQPSRLVRGVDTGPDYIAQCIRSWRAAGFDVLSINPAAELDAIATLGLPVRVEASTGSGLPLIAEMLSAARGSGCRLAGIVNADCHMLPVDKLRDRLQERSVGRILLCERVDRDQNSLLPLAETYGGFDGFFFDPQAIDISGLTDHDPAFRLGDVWWDFWFPCFAMAQGLKVGRLMLPILGHLNHAFRWSPEAYSVNRDRFSKTLPVLGGQLHARPELNLFAKVMVDVAEGDPASFALITRRWLRQSADCRQLALYDYPASLAEEYMTLLQRVRHQRQPIPEAPLTFGEHLQFAAGFPGCRFLTSGWSFPEDWGCWIDGNCGELLCGPLLTGGDIRVDLTLRAHVSELVPQQMVTVCVNDVPLVSQTFRDDCVHQISFVAPHRLTSDAPEFQLSIWASGPHSPRATHGSEDDRQLGIGVAAISVRPC